MRGRMECGVLGEPAGTSTTRIGGRGRGTAATAGKSLTQLWFCGSKFTVDLNYHPPGWGPQTAPRSTGTHL